LEGADRVVAVAGQHGRDFPQVIPEAINIASASILRHYVVAAIPRYLGFYRWFPNKSHIQLVVVFIFYPFKKFFKTIFAVAAYLSFFPTIYGMNILRGERLSAVNAVGLGLVLVHN